MRVGVDVGGTFTDLVALGEDGTISVRKVATTPEDPVVGMFHALELLDAGREAPAPAAQRAPAVAGAPRPASGLAINLLVHGTTIATNALLERTGARVVLVTTGGFEDLLWLRRQDRAALYDLARDHPPPLVARGGGGPRPRRKGPGGGRAHLRNSATAP